MRQLVAWLTWALFGNDEDGPLGDLSFNPERVETWRIRFAWWRKNPAHNFCFHVIGVAGEPFVRTGTCPADVFSPTGVWNVSVIHYKWLRLPFVSYQGKRVKWYIGWRERGDFGIKFNIKTGT